MKETIPLRIKIFLIASITTCITYAQLGLPSVFSDGMVLQRNSEVPIWGWGAAGSNVSIVAEWSQRDTTVVQVNSMGKWMARVKTGVAGGPYSIQIKNGRNKIELSGVMLGEVWLCSGQSNMEWSVNNGILKGNEEAAAADYKNLKIFQLPKRGSDTPQDNCEAGWETSSPESMRKNSAIAYFFGRYLSEKLNIPIGVIVSAWGGTPAETWTPSDIISGNEILSENNLKVAPWWPIEAGKLYNGMIHPTAPYNIAGCIWYQGESNQTNAKNYSLLMEKMIESWRKSFKKDFPFYLVQIAPHTYNSQDNGPALLREQQELVTRKVDNTDIITISDLVDNVKQIHPLDKRSVGERLANMALSKIYGREVGPFRSPSMENVEIVKNKIIISFKDLKGKLICSGKDIVGATICDESGVFVEAKAQIKNNKLVIWSPVIKKPQEARYCFDDATIGNLFSEEKMPVSPFRTSTMEQ